MGEFLRCEHGDFRRTAKVGLVARENHVGPAAFGGAELQRILEIIQPEFDGAERIGVADGCDGADAEQVVKKLDRLCCAAITAQDVEEVRQGVPRDVHLVGLGLALFQAPACCPRTNPDAAGRHPESRSYRAGRAQLLRVLAEEIGEPRVVARRFRQRERTRPLANEFADRGTVLSAD